jgi:hypothetical protein
MRLPRPYPLARIQPTISAAIWEKFQALAKRRGRQVSRELEAALVRYLHAEEPGGGPRAAEIPFPLCFVYRPKQERERREWEKAQDAVAGLQGLRVSGSASPFVARGDSAPGNGAGSRGAGDAATSQAPNVPADPGPAVDPLEIL